MVPFQDTQKILRENTRFTRNSESKREFFTKHPQVNIFLIEAFSGLDLQVSTLLITFYLIMNRLTEGNSQNQAKELCVLRYNVLVHFPFLFFILIFFSLFSLFVCVINYLFSLGLHSFSIFEHVRLSNLIFVLSMFFFFGFRVLGVFAYACLLHAHAYSKYAYTYNQDVYTGLMYAHSYSCPETLIKTHFTSVSLFY